MKSVPCAETRVFSDHRDAAIRHGAADPSGAYYANRRLPADAREITSRAVRLVWETMTGANPPLFPDPPHLMPPDLVSFAAAKGSLGAVMNALDQWGLSDCLEEKERQKARLALTRTEMATAAMRKALVLILSACEKRKIDIVLFKGHDLITVCYHDDAIRPVTDADLLVRRRDYPGLTRILADAGFRRQPGRRSTKWCRGSLIMDVHLGFVGDAGNPASACLPRIEPDEVFDNAAPREIDGVSYLSPDPHHSLIMTALHALTHSYIMDFWFMDAGALLIGCDRPPAHSKLIDIARKHRLGGVLDYHLWALREIFGYPGDIPLPAAYRPPRPIGRLIRAAARRTDYLFFGDILLGFTIDSHRKKLYYFKEMVFPSRNIVARETGVDPHSISGLYWARLLHLVKSVFHVCSAGRR